MEMSGVGGWDSRDKAGPQVNEGISDKWKLANYGSRGVYVIAERQDGVVGPTAASDPVVTAVPPEAVTRRFGSGPARGTVQNAPLSPRRGRWRHILAPRRGKHGAPPKKKKKKGGLPRV
jgi:hypothetical protein